MPLSNDTVKAVQDIIKNLESDLEVLKKRHQEAKAKADVHFKEAARIDEAMVDLKRRIKDIKKDIE